jgi:hypothetical protein
MSRIAQAKFRGNPPKKIKTKIRINSRIRGVEERVRD